MSGRAWTTADALRVMRAVGRDIASGDPIALPDVRRMRDELDKIEAAAVGAYRATGFTDAMIGRELGVSKQAIQKRFPRQP